MSSYNIVTDFGADPTGTTDSSPAIQGALDAVGLDGRGVVTFPPGEYRMVTGVTVQQPGRLVINATAARVFRDPLSNATVMFDNAGPNTGYDNAGEISVVGGTWDGSGADNTLNVDMFYFQNARRIRYTNLNIRGIVDWHGIELRAVDGGEVFGCRFEDFWLHNPNRHFTEAIQIQEGADDTMSKNLFVERCSAYGGFGTLVGTHTYRPGLYHDGIRVVNNYAENLAHYAVRARTWRNAVISGNHFIGCRGGVIVGVGSTPEEGAWDWSESQNVTVKGNTFENTEDFSVVHVRGDGPADVEDIIIADNIALRYAAPEGIYVEHAHEFSIIGNILKNGNSPGGNDYAIRVDASYGGVVTGNNVRGSNNGILVNANDSEVSGNRVY